MLWLIHEQVFKCLSISLVHLVQEELIMTTVTQMKCACDSCLCIVDTSQALEKDGHYFCSDACADGHPEGSSGCGHTGCGCNS